MESGDLLRAHLERRGMRVADLARRLDLQWPSVSAWLTGVQPINMKRAMQVADALDLDRAEREALYRAVVLDRAPAAAAPVLRRVLGEPPPAAPRKGETSETADEDVPTAGVSAGDALRVRPLADGLAGADGAVCVVEVGGRRLVRRVWVGAAGQRPVVGLQRGDAPEEAILWDGRCRLVGKVVAVTRAVR